MVNAAASACFNINPVADIQGAKSAGLTTIYVPVGAEYAPCSYADSTYPNMAELVEHINLKVGLS